MNVRNWRIMTQATGKKCSETLGVLGFKTMCQAHSVFVFAVLNDFLEHCLGMRTSLGSVQVFHEPTSLNKIVWCARPLFQMFAFMLCQKLKWSEEFEVQFLSVP